MTASELILQKAIVASGLDSSQWNRIQAGLRNRAFFSSRVARANILMAARDLAAKRAAGEIDPSKARVEFRKMLADIDYKPDLPEFEGTIKDLRSQSRIDAIMETNAAQAHGYLQYAEGMSAGAFAAFPAQEFRRVEYRKQPRDFWPRRWAEAGGRLYGGKMIALKDDPVWQALGDAGPFGNPYPPFDWGSGMGVLDVDRKTAIELGLIDDAALREKAAEIRKKPLPDFNRDMQAAVPNSAAGEIRKLFGEDFGDLVQVKDGVVKWRPEVLEETLLQGDNFNMKIGKPQKDLLDMMRADPKLMPFADRIEGKQLFVDQTWRDTKRSNGTTHLSHFYPIPEYPEDIPLKPEDMEMLPTMWHKPNRVLKIGSDKFMAELDAFDGSTYIMQIAFRKDGNPKLWAFFRTMNPTSKKIARAPAASLPTQGQNQRA